MSTPPAPPPRPGPPTTGPAAPGPPAAVPPGAPAAVGEAAENDAVASIPVALAALEQLDGRPTAEHVPAFERMHTVLTGALSAIDGV